MCIVHLKNVVTIPWVEPDMGLAWLDNDCFQYHLIYIVTAKFLAFLSILFQVLITEGMFTLWSLVHYPVKLFDCQFLLSSPVTHWFYFIIVLLHVYLQDGVWIKGLFLEGAGWERKSSCLMEPNPMELVCPMPTIHFKPIENKRKHTKGIMSVLTIHYTV